MRRLLAGLVALAALSVVPAAPAAAQAPGCDVVSARLDWGFKESFRAYIDGSIANGEWTVADGATYETPSFGFSAASGRLDPRAPLGSIDFPGSVRFTGHGGVLDTTIANPVLLFRGEEDALLLLDLRGATMEGDAVAVTATPFVAIDLAGQRLDPVDGVVTIDEAPTTLTGDGELAFPDYAAGTAFDPISATIEVGDCDLTGQPVGTDVIDGGSGSDLLSLIVGAAVVALLAAITIVFARRRRQR